MEDTSQDEDAVMKMWEGRKKEATKLDECR